MTIAIRRVVTGHDDQGKAIVLFDEQSPHTRSNREGHQSCVIWSTESFPTDNSGNDDGAARATGSTDSNGTVFRIVRYDPGVAPRNHRTASIDYAVVMSGEIDMEVDGTTVRLRAGDILVQRGTVHNWINRGTEPCTIVFVLVAARPVERGGKLLRAMG
jgi:quercetin dioxygenase-like cupin family protein